MDYALEPAISGMDALQSEITGEAYWAVPVLRVFGRTPEGDPALLRVHGMLPRVLVALPEGVPNGPGDVPGVLAGLGKELDAALRKGEGSGARVHSVTLVRAEPLYGLHGQEEPFACAELTDPRDLPRACEHLLLGSCLRRSLQPYEAHIAPKLQAMLVTGITGGGIVEAWDARIRGGGGGGGLGSSMRSLLDGTGPSLPHEMHCHVSGVLGEGDSGPTRIAPTLAALWDEERIRRQAKGRPGPSKSRPPRDCRSAGHGDFDTSAAEPSGARARLEEALAKAHPAPPSGDEGGSVEDPKELRRQDLVARAIPANSKALTGGLRAGGTSEADASEAAHRRPPWKAGKDTPIDDGAEEEEEGVAGLLRWIQESSEVSERAAVEGRDDEGERKEIVLASQRHNDDEGGSPNARRARRASDESSRHAAAWSAGSDVRASAGSGGRSTASEEGKLLVLNPRSLRPPDPSRTMREMPEMGVGLARHGFGDAAYSRADDWRRATRGGSPPYPSHPPRCNAAPHCPPFSQNGREGGIPSEGQLSLSLPRPVAITPGKVRPPRVEEVRAWLRSSQSRGRKRGRHANMLHRCEEAAVAGLDNGDDDDDEEEEEEDHDGDDKKEKRRKNDEVEKQQCERHGAQPSSGWRPGSPKYEESIGLGSGSGSAKQRRRPGSFSSSSAVTPAAGQKNSLANTVDETESWEGILVWAVIEVEAVPEDGEEREPNPARDSLRAVCLSAQCGRGEDVETRTVVLFAAENNGRASRGKGCRGVDTAVACESEEALLRELVARVRALDPDFVLGFDMERGSLGYVRSRSSKAFNWDAFEHMGRADPGLLGPNETPSWAPTGRVGASLWRAAKQEGWGSSDTLEGVLMAALGERLPRVSWQEVSRQWDRGEEASALGRLASRCQASSRVASALGVAPRATAMARAIGCDPAGVIHRGSQYRVEAMVLRAARGLSMAAPSPSKAQVQAQPAMSRVPLTMEPKSGFYGGPVVVLDFRSLYPSLVVAHNLCFSTVVGSAPFSGGVGFAKNFKLRRPSASASSSSFFIAPNGAAFVREGVKEGVLPRVLREVLEARDLAKAAEGECAAECRSGAAAKWSARQLALKLLANVTYGYAAAGFSGRMPMAELADAIVSLGRTYLEGAAKLAKELSPRPVEVAYGDTDSLFLHFPGISRQEARECAEEVCRLATERFPHPVALRVERLYHPCLLCVKKRYAGWSHPVDENGRPELDCKGLEAARSDACPAVAKCQAAALEALFRSGGDLSAAKQPCQRAFRKLLKMRLPLSDLIFRREARQLPTSAGSPLPPLSSPSLTPAAIVAARRARSDPLALPLPGERVPFVVLAGHPSDPIVSLVAHPLEVRASSLPSSKYYLRSALIPALERCLGLAGGDPAQWLDELPRSAGASSTRRREPIPGAIAAFFPPSRCSSCGTQLPTAGHWAGEPSLCCACSRDPQAAVHSLLRLASTASASASATRLACSTCGGGVHCLSVDCPMLFIRRAEQHREAHYLRLATHHCSPTLLQEEHLW